MAKVERIRKEEQSRTNKRMMNLSDTKRYLPNISMKKIGHIKTVEQFTSLVVNTTNIASTFVDTNAMETVGSECFLVALSNYSIALVGLDFVAWTQQRHRGDQNAHLTLFDYYNFVHLTSTSLPPTSKHQRARVRTPSLQVGHAKFEKSGNSHQTHDQVFPGPVCHRISRHVTYLCPYSPSLMLWLHSVLQ